jgi:AraC-like DNA-binding protein
LGDVSTGKVKASKQSAVDLPPLSGKTAEGESVRPEDVARWREEHTRTYRRLWHVDLRPLEGLPLSPRPDSISVQVVQDTGYRSVARFRQKEDHCYFCYSLGGAGAFADPDGTYPVPAGCGFLMEANDPRVTYFYPHDREPWRFLAFTFSGLVSRAMVRDWTGRFGPVFRLDPQAPIVRRLLAHEVSGYAIVDLHAVDATEMVLETLLALAAGARAAEEPNPALGLVRTAIQVIRSEAEADLSVDELARRVGVSREHLARAFRLRLDRSPHEVIREQKMRRACFLLKDTDEPIKLIAARLGYTDYTNFIHAFRTAAGMTPREFRRRGSITLLPQFSNGGSPRA